MKFRKVLLCALASLGLLAANASGFALYEASAISHAMGGALVGKAMDASANFNNPATLSDLTNLQFTVGFVTEHPRGAVDVYRNGVNCGNETMDSGLFWLPHFMLAVPLKWDFTFGLAGDAEYGLGTKFADSWAMNWNSTETTVQGFVLNPNLAYEIIDGLSVGAGMRWLFFTFEQFRRPYADPYGLNTFDYHLKGDNRFESLGWQLGLKYDILDNLSVGAVYKSAIDVDVRGSTSMDVNSVFPNTLEMNAAMSQAAMYYRGDADAQMTIPQSVTLGVNWDVVKSWHLGTAVSWTEWSQFDTLVFNVKPVEQDVNLYWRDTWRFSVGSCWDFIEDWKWMVSYVYDMDSTSSEQSSTMLPPADRHILSTGLSWNCWAGLELTLSYSCVFMDGGDMHTTDSFGNKYDLETCWGYCHAAGFSITYRF